MSAVLPGGGVPAPRVTAAGEAPRPTVEPRVASAAERLEASRTRLRTALMDIAHPPAKPSLIGELGLGSFTDQILDRVKALPGAAIVLETLQKWWAQHPLHTAGAIAEEASRRLVGPIARKNPYAVIIGGVVVGALFAVSKPWRWLLRPALFVGLVPQLATQALKHMPLDTWLGMLSSMVSKRSPAASSSAVTPDPASRLPKGS